MESEYRIALHGKTPTGYETYGMFYIGNDSVEVNRLFHHLKGCRQHREEGLLLMELQAIYRGLPIDMQMIHCTLEDVAENTRLITKYLFKSLSFEGARVH
jgi:hypothetical protein